MAAAAVAGVEGMTRALALDTSPDTRQCGGSRSDRHAALGLFWSTAGCVRREGAAKLPVGRMGRPDEVAEAVLFLMTNGFVTGTVLTIDGGGGLGLKS